MENEGPNARAGKCGPENAGPENAGPVLFFGPAYSGDVMTSSGPLEKFVLFISKAPPLVQIEEQC